MNNRNQTQNDVLYHQLCLPVIDRNNCNGANDAVMIHTSQQSVRKQKAKTFPSTDEPDLKTSCTGQQHRISAFYFKPRTKRQQRMTVDRDDDSDQQ
jgi:hypothetical protein